MTTRRNKRTKNMSIKKGDIVRVIAGTDKGAEGRVIAVQADNDRVIVEGVNRVKRHTKVVNQGGRAGTTGGIVTQEAAVHVSNVMLLVDPPKKDGGDGKGEAKGKVTTRLGFRRDEVTKRRPDGSTYTAHRSVRVSRKSGEEV
ncbi:MAG: LSU ribosomal protein L24p (L26e) [uncultured Nocardioidaceae bacterium]|uniref:Large ribosomal subunit protein uL24 n=1 Tax=uncultured Nocardioidaceae bacterium TaxID=253824 RepID=A0A6J4LZ49_9ACTN|nr:MAG: LSU ribosomal protein L24p (L26e) [uncultured Nocardioidaceae bacterium]